MNLGYLKNELLKRKRRAMFSIFGIAIGISVFVAVNSLADAFMNAVQRPLGDFGSDIILQRSGDTPDDFQGATLPCAQVIITAQELANLRNIDGVKKIAIALLMWVFEGSDYNDNNSFAIVTGIEPGLDLGPGVANDWVTAGVGMNPSDSGVALVESSYAGEKNIKLGNSITITGKQFKVIGIVKTPANALISTSNVFIMLRDAQEIAQQAKNIPGYAAGDVNQVFLKVDTDNLNAISSEIKKAAPGITVTSAESFIKAIGGVAAQSGNFAIIGSITVLLFSLIVVMKTVSGNIMERRNEIGIMKTVGWTSKNIYSQITAETLVQCVIGGIVGIAVGFAAAFALGNLQVSMPVSWDIDPFPHFMATDTSQKTLKVGLPVQISMGLIGISLAISVIMGVLSTLLTLKSINKIKPSEALRYE